MRTLDRKRLFIVLCVVALVIASYAAAGFLLAPRLIEKKLAALADQRLGQRLVVDKVRVNPFAISVEMDGLRLGQATGQPILAARRLYVNLALWRSGFGRGWVLGEVQIDGMQALLELQKDGLLNVTELGQKWKQTAPPAKPDEAPPKLTVGHLLLADGVLTYRELTGSTASTQVLPIRIELQDVSTLPDREGRYNVAARFVDGATLTWRGDLSMQPVQSEGDVELQSLKLATVWPFVRDELRMAEPEGWLSASLHYRFGYAGNAPQFALTKVRAHVAGLSARRDGFREPILALKSIEARDGRVDFGRGEFVLPALTLSDGRASIARDNNGAWNWDLLRESKPAPPARDRSGPTDGKAKAWHVEMPAVKMENVGVLFQDWQHPTPLSMQATANGRASIALETASSAMNVSEIDLKLEKVRLPADQPAVELATVHLQAGYLDLARREAGAKLVAVEHGAIRIERNANGTFPLQGMFVGTGPAAEAAAATPSKPWRYVVDAARLRQLDVVLNEQAAGKSAVYKLNGISLNVANIANASDKPVTFDASATIGSGGTISAKGSANPDLSRADAKLKLAGFALAPLRPLIARHVAVDLVSGSASASAALEYKRGDKPALTVKGPFELRDVRFNEAGTENRLLAWKRLASTEARFEMDPDRVRVKQIVVEEPAIKVDISEKRELNLMQVFRHDAGNPPAPAETPTATGNAMSIHIGEVRLRNGTVDYADRSLVLPFATQITDFAGSAASLSTDRDRHANLQFDGDIGEFGSAEIEGSLDAFSPRTFADIRAQFQNVEMSELSPYSATFLGRKIASGKLWLDLKYRVDNGALSADNDITIHKLALGEPVEAPGVRRLPLDLAVALLTDSKGVIRAAVPVTGDLNDPKFALGSVIREALGSMIAKIVTAPFRALAGIFGNHKGGKDVGRIEFEAGSARLMPSEKEKLQSVAKALTDRPQLNLLVQAPFSADADREAIQRDQAAREVAASLGRALEPGERPGPIVYENLATQRALERVFSKKSRSGDERDLVAQFTKQAGHEPKRAGTLLRTPGEPEFYKAMFEQIARGEEVGDASLQQLAADRASSVTETLLAAGIDAQRVQAGHAQPGKAEGKSSIAAELSLQPADRPGAAAQTQDKPTSG